MSCVDANLCRPMARPLIWRFAEVIHQLARANTYSVAILAISLVAWWLNERIPVALARRPRCSCCSPRRLQVGAALFLDVSRLARNGRDWHHLLELCGPVEALVIDLDGRR
jgi:hypothetical protein